MDKMQMANGLGQNTIRHFAYCLCTIVSFLLTIASCTTGERHKHIPTSQPSELDGLAQPANQTVFSDSRTIFPQQKSITPILTATGIITYDPRLSNTISARYNGRIEKLYVRFNFESVSKGQRIMDIYSPEILTEQQNLIFLLRQSSGDTLQLRGSRQKLLLLGLTKEQLTQIETNHSPINPLPVFSPYGGHIHDIGTDNGSSSSTYSSQSGMSSGMNNKGESPTSSSAENSPASSSSALSIKEGMYVQSGQPLFAVYNVNQVWAVLNIFPQDANLIKVGDKVSISAETNPDHLISSTIKFIEPVTDQNASTIRARVYVQNADKLNLKIGVLLSAKITASAVEGLWLPRNAVVNLGQKQVVFLKTGDHFTANTVQTGVAADALLQIVKGLDIGDQVAENAQFLVDSESFIQTEQKNESENK